MTKGTRQGSACIQAGWRSQRGSRAKRTLIGSRTPAIRFPRFPPPGSKGSRTKARKPEPTQGSRRRPAPSPSRGLPRVTLSPASIRGWSARRPLLPICPEKSSIPARRASPLVGITTLRPGSALCTPGTETLIAPPLLLDLRRVDEESRATPARPDRPACLLAVDAGDAPGCGPGGLRRVDRSARGRLQDHGDQAGLLGGRVLPAAQRDGDDPDAGSAQRGGGQPEPELRAGRGPDQRHRGPDQL